MHASRVQGEALLAGLCQTQEEGNSCFPLSWTHDKVGAMTETFFSLAGILTFNC